MDDRDYFYRRAEAELLMAEKAVEPAAVAAHHKLAEHYLARVYGEDGRAMAPMQVASRA